METKILNVEIYGLKESIVRSKYPLSTEIEELRVPVMSALDNHINRAKKLGQFPPGSGHDKYLRGIIVQFDLIAPRYFFQEWDTYHFQESISSQSTMHCIGKFNIDQMVNFNHIDEIIISRFKELVQLYNANPTIENLLLVKHNMPEGVHIGRGVTSSYAQLKTIWKQRHNHKLPDWSQVVCPWIEGLPYFKELCLRGE